MPLFAWNRAQRRYQHRVSIAMGCYVVLLIAEIKWFAHPALTGPMRFALTLLPGLAVSMVFLALGRYLVEEQDEYLRARAIQKIVWATGVTLVACTLWGFPEDAGLLPHVPLYFAAIAWLAAFGSVSCLFKVVRG